MQTSEKGIKNIKDFEGAVLLHILILELVVLHGPLAMAGLIL